MKQFIAMLMLLLMTTMSLVSAATEQTTDVQANADATVETTKAGTRADVKYKGGNVEIETETQAEVEDMHIGPGARMRLLQLQEQLERRIVQAEEVITTIEAKNSTVNTTVNATADLKAIVVQLETLSADVDVALNATNNQSNKQAIETFIDVKTEARELVAEFRTIAKPLLTSDDRDDLESEFEQAETERMKGRSEASAQARAEFHAAQVQALLTAMGKTDAELVAQVRAGEISGKDAIEQLRDEFETLTEEQKKAAAVVLREQMTKRQVALRAQMSDAAENMRARLAVRLEERADILEERGLIRASSRLRLQSESILGSANLTGQQIGDLREELRIKYETRNDSNRTRSEIRIDDERVEIRERTKVNGVRTETRERIRIDDDAQVETESELNLGVDVE